MTLGGRDQAITSLWQIVDLQLRSVLHRQCNCLQVVAQAGSGLPNLNLLSFLLASLHKGKLSLRVLASSDIIRQVHLQPLEKPAAGAATSQNLTQL